MPFAWIRIVTFMCLVNVYRTQPYISCNTGNFISSHFVMNYSIQHSNLNEFGNEEMPPEDLSSWPGEPSNLQIDVKDTMLKISWKTPDDGSVRDLQGFLVQMYLQTDLNVIILDPVASFEITLQKVDNSTPLSTIRDQWNTPMLQDAVFTLTCHTATLTTASVDIYVTSLPIGRGVKEATATVQLNEHTQPTQAAINETSAASPTEMELVTTTPNTDVTATTIAIVVAIICCMIVATSVGRYILKRRHNSRDLQLVCGPINPSITATSNVLNNNETETTFNLNTTYENVRKTTEGTALPLIKDEKYTFYHEASYNYNNCLETNKIPSYQKPDIHNQEIVLPEDFRKFTVEMNSS